MQYWHYTCTCNSYIIRNLNSRFLTRRSGNSAAVLLQSKAYGRERKERKGRCPPERYVPSTQYHIAVDSHRILEVPYLQYGYFGLFTEWVEVRTAHGELAHSDGGSRRSVACLSLPAAPVRWASRYRGNAFAARELPDVAARIPAPGPWHRQQRMGMAFGTPGVSTGNAVTATTAETGVRLRGKRVQRIFRSAPRPVAQPSRRQLHIPT